MQAGAWDHELYRGEVRFKLSGAPAKQLVKDSQISVKQEFNQMDYGLQDKIVFSVNLSP